MTRKIPKSLLVAIAVFLCALAARGEANAQSYSVPVSCPRGQCEQFIERASRVVRGYGFTFYVAQRASITVTVVGNASAACGQSAQACCPLGVPRIIIDANTQDRAELVFLHELGHGLGYNHGGSGLMEGTGYSPLSAQFPGGYFARLQRYAQSNPSSQAQQGGRYQNNNNPNRQYEPPQRGGSSQPQYQGGGYRAGGFGEWKRQQHESFNGWKRQQHENFGEWKRQNGRGGGFSPPPQNGSTRDYERWADQLIKRYGDR